MKPKYLKILIYIAGFFCMYTFIAVRIHPLFNVLLTEKLIPEYWENTKWGELYYFNYIKHFREKNLPPAAIKYRFTKKHPKLNQAEILTFGDSFFDYSRMETFPEQLGDSLHKKVYYARMDRPLSYLQEHKYHTHEPKPLIYETAERYIPTRFTIPHKTTFVKVNRGVFRKALANIRDFIFPKNQEKLYDVLLNRSFFTNAIYTNIATFKFDTWGYVPRTTPIYSLKYDEPWLFYYEETNDEETSFYYNFSQKEIDTYCDNIADLANKLYNNYNLEMVFLAIPSKYTIYHKLVNNDQYNNFLPRIYEGLAKRNVPYVDVYHDFVASKDILFYGTDTHWNPEGLKIALQNTIHVLDTLKIIN